MNVDDTSQQAMLTQIRADASQQSSWMGDAFHQMWIISSGAAPDGADSAWVAGMHPPLTRGAGVQIPCRPELADLRGV